MPKLIDTRGALLADPWQTYEGDIGSLAPDMDLVVPLDIWREYQSLWGARIGRVGVLLMPGDDLAALAGDIGRLELLAIRFPAFTDGRGYSMARLVRERFGYRAELRATGDVLVDQLYYLRRCGFDRFALRDDQDPQLAPAALVAFSNAYQAAVDDAPLFRRRNQADSGGLEGQAARLGAFGVSEPLQDRELAGAA